MEGTEAALLILIEGPDRCGKTQLARRIAERFDLPYVHRSQPTRHVLHEYVTSIDEDMRQAGHVLLGVADRWHLGEVVYPTLYPQGRRPLRAAQRLWIELALYARGAFMIGATDDPHHIRQRVEEDSDSYLRPDDVEQCHDLFTRLFRDSILDVIHYNEAEEFKLDELMLIAELSEQRIRYLANDLVVGNTFAPEVMLVGDRVNDEEESEFTRPFAPVSGSSGDYLMGSLYHVWPREALKHLLVVNSRRPDGEHEDLIRIHRLAGSPRVVALGREAQRLLERLGIEHGVVPHPQWVRRFRYHEKVRYATSISAAAASHDDLIGAWKGAPE